MPVAAATKPNETAAKPDKAGEKKPSNKERIQEIVKGIEDGIQNLFQSEKFADYLRTMSRFHSYSLNNTILIHLQKPNATRCAGFKQWRDKFGRHVKKGEHGITIIAPTPIKKRMERDKLDPDTRLPMQDAAGNPIKEIVEISIPLYKPVKVFDVSQTEGKPLPELVSPLSGDVQQYDAFMEALRRTSPVPISFEELPATEDGYFSVDDQKIAIREGMSQVQTVCATVHEMAHSVLHNQTVTEKKDPTLYTIAEICNIPAIYHKDRIPQKNVPGNLYRYEVSIGADGRFKAVGKTIQEGFAGTVLTAKPLPIPENGLLNLDPATHEKALLLSADMCTIGHFQRKHVKDRHTEEVEAESVSYAVCQYFGIETSANSFGYIATWSKGRELKELKASLETITSATSFLISNIEKHFREICKDRGINLDAQTAQAAEAVQDGGTVQPETAVRNGDMAQPETAVQNGGTVKPGQTQDSGTVKPEAAGQNTVTEQAAQTGTTAANVLVSVQPVPVEAAVSADTQTAAQSAEAVNTVQNAPAETDGPAAPAQMESTEPEAAVPVPASSEEPVEAAGQAETPVQNTVKGQEQETANTPEETKGDAEAILSAEPLPLDQYPVPDKNIAPDALSAVGYNGDDLIAVTRDRACELMDQDMTVYTLLTGENPEMAFDSEDIRTQPDEAYYGVPRDEWEASPEFQAALDERLTRQEERENALIGHDGPCFGLYRLREDSGVIPVEMRVMRETGNVPDRKNYNLVYTGELAGRKNIHEALKLLNENPPPDFPGSAPIFSDVIAVKNDSSLFCYYIASHVFNEFSFSDFMGFDPEKQKEQAAEKKNEQAADRTETAQSARDAAPDTLPPSTPDPAQTAADGPTVAELEARVKAGQTISLMELAEATRREEQNARQRGGRRRGPTHAARESGPALNGNGAVMPGPSVEAMDAAIRAGRSFTLRGLAAEEAQTGGVHRKASILSGLRQKPPETEKKRDKPPKSTERGL